MFTTKTKNITLHLLLIILNLIFTSKMWAYTVIIDPGHGGTDTGATRSIFQESTITLQLSLKVQQLLKEQQPDITTFLTRDNDSNLTLEERVQFAEKQKAQLFVSIHANSSPVKSVSGMEFYFKQGLSIEPSEKTLEKILEFVPLKNIAPINEKENRIVRKMTADLVDWGQLQSSLAFNKILQSNTDITKSIIRRAPFFVVENLAIPSVLIEIGYISNMSEAKKLLNDDYQNQIAQSIVKSISEFKNHSLNFESKSN